MEGQRITTVITIHSEGDTNVWIKVYGNLSDILLKTMKDKLIVVLHEKPVDH